MSRYIDADVTLNIIKKYLYETALNNITTDSKVSDICEDIAIHRIDVWIDEVPTADVVEVVRCEDCDFWQTDWIPNHGGDRGCHYCEMMDTFTEPLNYCGYAERKILPKP